MNNKKWLYIFTRNNLSPSQIAVQSIHAAFEMGRHFPKEETHPSVVLIKLKSEYDLIILKDYLEKSSLKYKEFIEPYYKNSLTSICVEPIDNNLRHIFKNFKLMRDIDFSSKKEFLL